LINYIEWIQNWKRFHLREIKPVMSITLKEIAELAGVSLATASRVINGRPGVKPQIRERVWQVIHEQEYEPSQAARSLAAQRAQKKVDKKE
jgi:plasmid maintenance system antidote protein VapI